MAKTTLLSRHHYSEGSFSDRRVVLEARPSKEAEVIHRRSADGPQHLHIGGAASDATLVYFAGHCGVELTALEAFRAEVAHA